MDQQQKIARHYLKTGILGAYETAEVAWEEESFEKAAPCFDDATVYFGTEQVRTERRMGIEGRRFRVSSVFPADADCTPTDRLLGLIDTELKKET